MGSKHRSISNVTRHTEAERPNRGTHDPSNGTGASSRMRVNLIADKSVRRMSKHMVEFENSPIKKVLDVRLMDVRSHEDVVQALAQAADLAVLSCHGCIDGPWWQVGRDIIDRESTPVAATAFWSDSCWSAKSFQLTQGTRQQLTGKAFLGCLEKSPYPLSSTSESQAALLLKELGCVLSSLEGRLAQALLGAFSDTLANAKQSNPSRAHQLRRWTALQL